MPNLSAIERLRAVLCNPEGKCCIAVSDEDRRIVDDVLADMEELVEAAREFKDEGTFRAEERLEDVLNRVGGAA